MIVTCRLCSVYSSSRATQTTRIVASCPTHAANPFDSITFDLYMLISSQFAGALHRLEIFRRRQFEPNVFEPNWAYQKSTKTNFRITQFESVFFFESNWACRQLLKTASELLSSNRIFFDENASTSVRKKSIRTE